jgi:hypothetical protein
MQAPKFEWQEPMDKTFKGAKVWDFRPLKGSLHFRWTLPVNRWSWGAPQINAKNIPVFYLNVGVFAGTFPVCSLTEKCQWSQFSTFSLSLSSYGPGCQILSPWLGGYVDFCIGLSCRTGLPVSIGWLAGTTTLCKRLYPPNKGLGIRPLVSRKDL